MKNKIKKSTTIFTGLFFSLLANFLVYSTAQAGGGGVSFPNPIKSTDIRDLAKKLLDVVVEFGAIIVVFFLVYAGFLFVKAQGNESEISKAKETFFWVIVGGMIVLGAHVLSRVIQNTVNQIQG